jgi:hypothetical protein
MKTISETIGGAQILFNISFDLQDCFEEYLTEEYRCFLTLLRVISEALPSIRTCYRGTGRIPYQNDPILKSFLAMRFFRIATVTAMISRLNNDPNLRTICGFHKVPSASVFSRRMKLFAEWSTMETTLDSLVEEYHQGRLVGHISRDSTAIAVREKPCNKKPEIVQVPEPKRKRGRPRKGEERPKKAPSVITQQIQEDPSKSLSSINKSCAWGCKKNSQGKVLYWKGVKLHLDVSDIGFPITAIITGANVHDSQLAIPMEKLTEQKITHLYSLMDAAYDSEDITAFILGKGRIPLIDQNKRRANDRPPFDPAEKERYKIRTTVERANSHLKDCLIPSQIFVRGFEKVSFILMCAVVCLAAMKILQYFILPELQKT